MKNVDSCKTILSKSVDSCKIGLAKKRDVHAIEVKSGKNVKHRALDKFMAKYPDWLDVPYLLWDRDLVFKDGILHLPLYMAPLL